MDPEEEKKKKEFAKNISELKDEGVDILPDGYTDLPQSTGERKSVPTPRTENRPPEGEKKQEERFITDKIPNVIKEAPFIAPERKRELEQKGPLRPDTISRMSAKLTSSAPNIAASSQKSSLQASAEMILGVGQTIHVPAAQEKTETTENIQEVARPKNDPSVRPLRTYRTDAEEVIKNQRMSVVNIAVAESRKKEEEEKHPITGKKTGFAPFAFILSIIFIASGIAAIYFVFLRDITVEPPVAVEQQATFIGEDETREIIVSSTRNPLEDFVNAIRTADGPGQGKILRLTPVSVDETGKKEITPTEFFEKATPRIPGRLLRSLDQQFALGVYELQGVTPFIVLFTTSFENAFAGMLEWETTLGDELSSFISLSHNPFVSSGVFYDKVLRNKDARVLQGTDGNEALFYAFVNSRTVVITTTKDTLEALIQELSATRVIR